MKHKKGTGIIVAWILLLGFAIGLAITVFFWSKGQTEKISESAVRYVEGGMQCDNVMINVAVSDTCELTVMNTRYLNVGMVKLRNLNDATSADCAGGSQLKVKESIVCTEAQSWCGNVTIMPIIEVNNDWVGCKNKAVMKEVTCGC